MEKRINRHILSLVLFVLLIVSSSFLLSCSPTPGDVIDNIEIEDETNQETNTEETQDEENLSTGLSMIIAENQQGYILSGIGSCKDLIITIPNEYNLLPIIGIAENAFKNNIQIKSIIIPKTISEIDDFAFSGCFSLESVEFEADSELISIGEKSFYRCESLAAIKIPNSVESLGIYSFAECISLGIISFPSSLYEVKEGAFYGTMWLESQDNGIIYAGNVAYSIKGETLANYDLILKDGTIGVASWAFSNILEVNSIFIPDSIMFIGSNAFVGCENLSSIQVGPNNEVFKAENNCLIDNLDVVRLGCVGAIIPENAVEIAENAFLNAHGIVQIEIPQNVKKMGKAVFKNCTSLLYLELPNELITIPEEAFLGCESMTEITIKEKILEINAQAFSGCIKLSNLIIDSLPVASGLTGFTSQGNILSNAKTIYINKNVVEIGAYIISHYIKEEISEYEDYNKYTSI